MQRLGCGDPGAVLAQHPALAEQHERAVRERRQIPGRAQRPVLRHPRRDSGVQQVHQAARQRRPYTRPAQRQRPYAQQHHRPHHFRRHRVADAGSMRTDQGVLKLRATVRGDGRAGKGAESGGHAVHGTAGRLDVVDDRAAGGHGIHGGVGDLYGCSVPGHGKYVGGGDAGGSDDDTHEGTPLCRTVRTSGTPGR
jgi:hypothetical protein